jgi:hypothetical protein
MTEFEIVDLRKFLKKHGFVETKYSEDKACFMESELYNVSVYMVTHEKYTEYDEGGFYAENNDCYDKIGKMPIRIPEYIDDWEELLVLLRNLGSKKGYEFSCNYGYCRSLEEWRKELGE